MTPADPDLDLLRFVISGDPDASDWNAWASIVDLDDHSVASFALLPGAFERLRELGIEHRWMPRLRGIYRRSWTQDQLTTTRRQQVEATLAGAGIDILPPPDDQVRRAMASPGTLPLGRQQLTIPWDSVADAADALRSDAFELRPTTTRRARLVTRLVSTRWSICRDDTEFAAVTDTYYPNRRAVDATNDVWSRSVTTPVGREVARADLLASALLINQFSRRSFRWAIALRALDPPDGSELEVPSTAVGPQHREVLERRLELYQSVSGRHIRLALPHADSSALDRSGELVSAVNRWGGPIALGRRLRRSELL